MFLRGQAQAILAADFFETQTVTGARLYIFAVIEHGARRVRVLGATGVRVPRMNAIMERWIRSCRATSSRRLQAIELVGVGYLCSSSPHPRRCDTPNAGPPPTNPVRGLAPNRR